MLVLSRKKGESVIIQDTIEVTLLEIDADTVKLGISAPKEVNIYRKELYLSIQESNVESAKHQLNLDEMKKSMNQWQKNVE